MFSISQIIDITDADCIRGNTDAVVSRVIHDTRRVQVGDFYVALDGERYRGSDFIKEAAEKGAVGALYDGDCYDHELPTSFTLLKVENSLEALTALAARWRSMLSLRSVVVTGSNGKTTTKDFIAAVLKSSLQTNSTHGNYNNHIGLPLSILSASCDDQVAVWEIGMNHRGEIAPLAALAKPEIAVVTNIGTAHIGFLGSREAIAEEKGDLLAALPATGVAIIPAADDFSKQLATRTEARIVTVGIDCGDLQATNIKMSEKGSYFQVCFQGNSYTAFLPLIGRHMINNALLALAVGQECGVSLEEGIVALSQVQPTKNRLAVESINDLTVLDDSYNASPDSVEAALTAMNTFSSGRKIAVLGRMGELGDYQQEGYQRVGRVAGRILQHLIVIGKEMAPLAQAACENGMTHVVEVENNSEASQVLASLMQPQDVILVKGSFSAKMKEVVEQLKGDALSLNNKNLQVD